MNNRLLQLIQCNHDRCDLYIDNDRLKCKSCGTERPIWSDFILTDPRLNSQDMESRDAVGPATLTHYEADTKHRYQSENYAQYYLNQYKYWFSMRNLYRRIIAMRERMLVVRLLGEIPEQGGLLLDLPAGTGKLANIYCHFNYDIIAGDVSADMLKAGMDEWQTESRLLGMIQTDITNTLLKADSIDCIVCLRLMHRLNLEITTKALEEMKRVGKKHLIISNAVSDFNMAEMLSSKGKKYSKSQRCNLSNKEWHDMLSGYGRIKESRYVWRGVSKEVISLVELNA